MKALIYIRDTEEKIEQIMPYASDPAWSVVREYCCPGCLSQLEVEAVPQGYPVIFDFLPDIEGFYNSRPELKKKNPGMKGKGKIPLRRRIATPAGVTG